MRVVHVPFCYYPDAVGGTEVYVAELVRELGAFGVESVVAAPGSGAAGARYEHDGVPVHRFAVPAPRDVRELYDEGNAAAAAALAAVIDEVEADVLHLHAFTRAGSLRALRAAHSRGAAVVFTYHTPTASCVRGTLMRNGREPCDGALVEQRCAACLLERHGVPRGARDAITALPPGIGASVAAGASRRWTTALRARELVGVRHEAFRALLREADAVVAVCDWVRAIVLDAGAPPDRVVVSRQGTPARNLAASRGAPGPDGVLRIAFAGRLHRTKGVHVLIAALAARRDLPVTLDVFGVAQDVDGARYREELRCLAKGDDRVRFRAPLPPDRVVPTLAGYHATVVPSQWLETGPLTVLESFAAGVPVVGSDLGGIAELVTHGRDGLLVPHASSAAWQSALALLAADSRLRARLRAGVRPPRTTTDVGLDMARLYAAATSRAAARLHPTPAGVA